MAPPVPACHVGYCCKVNLAGWCSLLTSRQVKYVEETFDLTNAMSTFDFVFRLYNFVSLANEDNNTLRDPFGNVAKLSVEISRLELPSLTSRKRKTRVDDDAGNGSSKKSNIEGGPAESDIVSDVAILEALKRGYTIPEEVEGFKFLLPVRVSFP